MIIEILPEALETPTSDLSRNGWGWERPVVWGTSWAFGAIKPLGDSISLSLYTEIVRVLTSFGLISPAKEFKAGTVYQLFGAKAAAHGSGPVPLTHSHTSAI